MSKTLVKDGELHWTDDSLKTRCGRSTVGMSPFEGWKTVCEKCYGPNVDLDVVAKKVGVFIKSDKPYT